MIQIEDIIFQLYTNVVNIRKDGDVYTCTDKDENPITVDMSAVNAEFTKQNYKNERVTKYPSVVDQLDLIYHSGIDAWKAKIKETKDKYPKP